MLPWGSGSYSPDLIHSKSPPNGPNLQKLRTGECFLFLSVAGIRYPYQRNLREKGFMLALNSRFQSMDAAESTAEETQSPKHTTPKEQREKACKDTCQCPAHFLHPYTAQDPLPQETMPLNRELPTATSGKAIKKASPQTNLN